MLLSSRLSLWVRYVVFKKAYPKAKRGLISRTYIFLRKNQRTISMTFSLGMTQTSPISVSFHVIKQIITSSLSTNTLPSVQFTAGLYFFTSSGSCHVAWLIASLHRTLTFGQLLSCVFVKELCNFFNICWIFFTIFMISRIIHHRSKICQ